MKSTFMNIQLRMEELFVWFFLAARILVCKSHSKSVEIVVSISYFRSQLEFLMQKGKKSLGPYLDITFRTPAV